MQFIYQFSLISSKNPIIELYGVSPESLPEGLPEGLPEWLPEWLPWRDHLEDSPIRRGHQTRNGACR